MTQSPHYSPVAEQRRMARPSLLQHVWAIAIAVVLLVVVAIGGWFWLQRDAAPRPIAQLQTQDFHALAWSPTDSNTVFFGHHNGLLQSMDGGHTWQGTALTGADAMSLAISPKAPDRLYATGHGVFLRSDDGGATWTAPETSVQGADLHGFAQNPVNPDHLVTVDVNQGLLASKDGGDTWKVATPTPPGQAIAFSADGTMLLSAAGDGVQQSTDGGITWTLSGSGLPRGAQVISVATALDGSLFAGTTNGLYRRIAMDDVWMATNLTAPILAVAASPLQQNVVLAVDQQGRVFRSEDNGASW